MRILHVVHDFLPDHVAGVEVYTDHVVRALAREHEVGLLYTESVPHAPNYALRRGHWGDVATWELVNNHVHAGLAETWSNPAVEARMCEVLDEFRPDVVHVQHLINLSLGVLSELDRRGVPVVMTLHEHWLACANGGQRFHRELGRCDVLDARRCAACTAHWHPPAGRLEAALDGAFAGAGGTGTLALVRLAPAIDAPAADFVYRDRYVLHGAARDTWVAHPPARLGFELHAGEGALFTVNVAMHASTFETPGGAVRFAVRVDGSTAAERRLDPRRDPADRFPRAIAVSLAPGRHRLELVTETDPVDAREFATAGWIDPRVRNAAAVPRTARARAGRAALRLADAAGHAPFADARRAVEARWAAVRHVARSVDRFLLPSRHLLDQMARFGLPADRLVHCDYGFPVDDFVPRDDLPEFARHFVFIGSVMRHKGMHVLLEAFEGMPADAQLSVAGSPSYDPGYSTWLHGSGSHPGLRFVGGVAPERVPAFLASADALVVPSIWQENSPLTIHEGFLAGIPVVASRMGGSTELIEAGGGLLYDADDPLALRAALRRLYDEPGLARRLAASAPPVKSMKEHVAELVELYDRVAGERRRSRG
jgi:glycosyltransferase involved in cell wall biosynthesis